MACTCPVSDKLPEFQNLETLSSSSTYSWHQRKRQEQQRSINLLERAAPWIKAWRPNRSWPCRPLPVGSIQTRIRGQGASITSWFGFQDRGTRIDSSFTTWTSLNMLGEGENLLYNLCNWFYIQRQPQRTDRHKVLVRTERCLSRHWPQKRLICSPQFRDSVIKRALLHGNRATRRSREERCWKIPSHKIGKTSHTCRRFRFRRVALGTK